MIEPTDLLNFAQEIFRDTAATETKIRTSIGRFYYAAYHFATRKYALTKGIPLSEVLNMGHATFIRNLKSDSDIKLVRLGNQLHDIKQDREKADYYLELNITRATGTKVLKSVDRAKATIDSI